MRLYYTAILRFGWGFEGGYNGILMGLQWEFQDRAMNKNRLGRQPLFWFGSKDGDQPTWAWAWM